MIPNTHNLSIRNREHRNLTLFLLISLVSLGLFFVPFVSSALTLKTPSNSLTSGLVGWWTFDGKDVVNGRANDISGNANHGNLTNISTSTFYKQGKLGQGFNFDGVDDYVVDTSVPPVAIPRTMAFWVKYPPIGNFYTPVTLGRNTATANLSYFDSKGDTLVYHPALGSGVSGTVITEDNKWHHIVGVSYSTADHRIFIDGVQRNASVTSVTLNNEMHTRWHVE